MSEKLINLSVQRLCMGFAACILLTYFLPDTYAQNLSERDKKMEEEMNCISQKQKAGEALDWDSVCMLSEQISYDDYSSSKPRRYPYKDPDGYRDPTNNFYNFSRENPSTKLELGLEVSAYEYEQPQFFTEEGTMYSLFGAYTYRKNDPRTRDQAETHDGRFARNMFRLEGRFGYGQVDYDADGVNNFTRDNEVIGGAGTLDDIDDYTAEVRGLAGYDFYLTNTTRITPYFGIGYRFLSDEFGDEGRTSTNQITYDRETSMVYLPIGFDTHTAMGDTWSVAFNAEFDWIFSGKHTSNFSDSDLTFTDATSMETFGLDDIENTIDNGFGIRTSLRFKKETESVDFFIEPFARYWEVERTDEIQFTSGENRYWTFVASGLPVTYAEPRNHTTEYGLKMGISY